MFVNGVEFMTTLSRKLVLTTAEHIPSWTDKQLGGPLNKIVELYARGGAIFNVFLMDQ